MLSLKWFILVWLLGSSATAFTDNVENERAAIEAATQSLAMKLSEGSLNVSTIDAVLVQTLSDHNSLFGSAFCFNPDTLYGCPFAFRNGDVYDTLDIADTFNYTIAEYYAGAAKGQTIWTQPYIDVGGAGGEICLTTYAVPVYDEGSGEFLGVLTGDLLLASVAVGEMCVLTSLLEGYDSRSAPADVVSISTGLYDVAVTEFQPFESKFNAVLWARMSWKDARLQWNPLSHNDTIEIDRDEIWYPRLLHFRNVFEEEVIFQSPAVIDSSGRVQIDINMQSTFLCDSAKDLRRFPFDSHFCSMNLGFTGHRLRLDYEHGFQVNSGDPNFSLDTSIRKDAKKEGETIFFGLSFRRRPFTAWVRLILPAVLVNLVGFMVFWVVAQAESIALGVTSLLCTLAFRETVNMPDTADLTWSEIFILLNIMFQALVMLIIFLSYSPHGEMINAKCTRAFGQWGPWFKVKENAVDAHDELKDENDEYCVDDYSAEEDVVLESGVAYSGYAAAGNSITPDVSGSATLRRRKVQSDGSKSTGRRTSILDRNTRKDELHHGLQEAASNKDTEESEETAYFFRNVDWIGRYVVVPGYVGVLALMVALGPKVF